MAYDQATVERPRDLPEGARGITEKLASTWRIRRNSLRTRNGYPRWRG